MAKVSLRSIKLAKRELLLTQNKINGGDTETDVNEVIVMAFLLSFSEPEETIYTELHVLLIADLRRCSIKASGVSGWDIYFTLMTAKADWRRDPLRHRSLTEINNRFKLCGGTVRFEDFHEAIVVFKRTYR